MTTNNPQRQWIVTGTLVGILTLLVAISAYQYYQKASKPSRLGTLTRTAFLRWRQPVHDLVDGVNVYAGNPYPNPPIMAILLYPLECLPPITGAMVWFFLKVGMAAACFIWAFRICESPEFRIPIWAKALAILFSLHPVLGDLSHGNVNIFIAFLVFACLELYRRKWDFSAGIVLGLAIACKVTPALLVPYFGWKWFSGIYHAYRHHGSIRSALFDHRVLWGTVAGLAIWLFAVPGSVVGWSHNVTLLETWYGAMVKPFVVDGKVTSEHANQSIPGVVFRLLTNEPSVIDFDDDDRPFGAEFHNLTDIGAANARWVIRVFQALFVIAIFLGCRTVGTRRGLGIAAEMSLIVLGMLLFSERTWKHHGVTLILPWALMTAVIADGWKGGLTFDRRSKLFGSVVLLAGGLTVVPSMLNEESQDLCLTYGSHTAAFLLVFAASFGILIRPVRTDITAANPAL
jgi:hypothetical protein